MSLREAYLILDHQRGALTVGGDCAGVAGKEHVQ